MIVQSPKKMVEMKRLIRRCVKFLVQVQLEVSGERFIIIHGTDINSNQRQRLSAAKLRKCAENLVNSAQTCSEFSQFTSIM